jgi:hypothetical protein
MEAQHKKFMQYHFKTFMEKLDIDLMVPYLQNHNVLTTFDVELFDFPGWDCTRVKVAELCHLITRRGEMAFPKFMIGLSILQPDLFKFLSEDKGTEMGPWLKDLERLYQVELEKEKQKAIMADVKKKREEVPMVTTDAEVNPKVSVDVNKGEEVPVLTIDGEVNPKLKSKKDVNTCSENWGTVKTKDEDVTMQAEDEHICVDETDVQINVQIRMEEVCVHSKDEQSNRELVLTPPPSEDAMSPPLMESTRVQEEKRGDQAAIPNADRQLVQSGQGNACNRAKSYDIGPDQIRVQPETRDDGGVYDDDAKLTPRTVFPLSLRKYALPAEHRDGSKLLHLKVVRSHGSSRRAMITLTPQQWGMIVETMEMALNVQSRVVKENKEISLCVHLGESVFMLVCPLDGNVEIRRYICRGPNKLAVPGPEGITLSPMEWRRLMKYRNRIQRQLQNTQQLPEENENPEQQCYLAGRHERFIGPRQCPDCGYRTRLPPRKDPRNRQSPK